MQCGLPCSEISAIRKVRSLITRRSQKLRIVDKKGASEVDCDMNRIRRETRLAQPKVEIHRYFIALSELDPLRLPSAPWCSGSLLRRKLSAPHPRGARHSIQCVRTDGNSDSFGASTGKLELQRVALDVS